MVFSMWSQDSVNHFPHSVKNIFVNTAQYVVFLHCYKGTLLKCISLLSTRNFWYFFWEAVYWLDRKMLVLLFGIIPSQPQCFTFTFIELPDIPVHHFFQPVYVLNSSLALPVQQLPPVWCCDNCSSLADAENSYLVAAWRYRGKTSNQICVCSRLNVSEQRKNFILLGKKNKLLLVPL